jgi:hypothetical protein
LMFHLSGGNHGSKSAVVFLFVWSTYHTVNVMIIIMLTAELLTL